jgi:hypothetical protein
MHLTRLSDVPYRAAGLDSAPIIRQLKRLYRQLEGTPCHLARLDSAPQKTLAMLRYVVTNARGHLVAMAATSDDLVRRTAGDPLGACESLAELIVRAVRRMLHVEVEALLRVSSRLEVRALERGLSMRLDEFARPLEIELRSISDQCARCQGTSQTRPAGYRATITAVAQSLRALVARPDVGMFLAEARRRTDWPAVARVCQRMWNLTQLPIAVDLAWLPHQLAERVAMVTRQLVHACERKASRAGLAPAICPVEAAGAPLRMAVGRGPTLIVVPPGMPDPAVVVAAYVLVNPGIPTAALRHCMALYPEQLQRTLDRLVKARLIRVENRWRSHPDSPRARDKVCFATALSSCSGGELDQRPHATAHAPLVDDHPQADNT